MLYEQRSTKSLEDIDQGFRAAAARHNFGVPGVHNLKEAMEKKGVSFSHTCLVYEVCNPEQAKKVLEANGAFSTVLPCRISVYGSEHNYRIAPVLPTALMTLFQSENLAPVAREVEDVVIKIIDETA